jgi:hypothetical protein
LWHVEKRVREVEYISNMMIDVIDIAWNPGEDVFLALYKDGTLRLYA